MITYTININSDYYELFREEAEKQKVSVSELARQVIANYIHGGDDVPIPDCKNDRRFVIKVHSEFLQIIDRYAIKHKIPRSQLARNAIKKYLYDKGLI
jgi:hypothetical protein